MLKPLDLNIRRKAVDLVTSGVPFERVAHELNVSKQAISDLMQLYHETGSIDPRSLEPGDTRGKLVPHKEWLRSVLQEDPPPTLSEICNRLTQDLGVSVNRVSLWRYIKRNDLQPDRGNTSTDEHTHSRNLHGQFSSSVYDTETRTKGHTTYAGVKIAQLVRPLFALEAIAQYGSVSLAARNIGISPQTVRTDIQKLEDELGYLVVHSNGKTITLTQRGTVFLNGATPHIRMISGHLSEHFTS